MPVQVQGSMRGGRLWRALAFVAAAALGLASSACDNTVSPLVDQPEEFFALFGFLDASADTQFVRVDPIRSLLDPATAPPFEARVTTTQLTTGATVAWRDSLVRNGGRSHHLFYALFTPEPGATYRLDVRRPDGQATSAIVQVPPRPELQRFNPNRGTFNQFSQEVLWLGVDQPPRFTVRYRVEPQDTRQLHTIELPYGTVGELRADGWFVEIHLERDFRTILTRLNRRFDDSTLVLLDLGMEIERLSPEWRDPTAEFNIEHGRGFFGALGYYDVLWTLDSTTAEAIGYFVP